MTHKYELEYDLDELKKFKLKEEYQLNQLYKNKDYKLYQKRKKNKKDKFKSYNQKRFDFFELNKFGHNSGNVINSLDEVFNSLKYGVYYLCIIDSINESIFYIEYVDKDKNIYRLHDKYKQSFRYDDYNLKKLGFKVGSQRHSYLEGYNNCFKYNYNYYSASIKLTFNNLENLSEMFKEIYDYNLSDFINLDLRRNDIKKVGSLNLKYNNLIKDDMLMYIIRELDNNNLMIKDDKIINNALKFLEKRYYLSEDEIKILKKDISKINLKEVMRLKKKKIRKTFVLFNNDYYYNKTSSYEYRNKLYNARNLDLNEIKKEYNSEEYDKI